MPNDRSEAFKNGREDGYAAGLSGASAPPKPDPVKSAIDAEFEKEYLQGLALGFARGEEHREMVQFRAAQQIEDREL